MTVPIPSDILSDVIDAADPAAYRAALNRLTQLQSAAAPDAARFSEQAAEVARGATAEGAGLSRANSPSAAGSTPGVVGRAGAEPSAYRKFEGFVLQVLIETMLPKDASAFGKGTPGVIWRSMMSEQLGNQLAATGGIGIARMLEKAHPTDSSTVEHRVMTPRNGLGQPTGEQKKDSATAG
jgi:peptidoglycan hydrolase FlgJ